MSSSQVGIEFYRQFGRSTRLDRQRPNPPRSLRYVTGLRLLWDAPMAPVGITHYRIYADDEYNLVRVLPFGQQMLEDNLVADRVFVSAYNSTVDVESIKMPLQGPIFLTGGAGPYVITWATTVNPDFMNGTIQVLTMTGNTIIGQARYGGSTNLPANLEMILILIQDAVAGRVFTFHSSWVGADPGMGEIGRPNIYTSFWFRTISVNGTVKPVLLGVPFTGKEWA